MAVSTISTRGACTKPHTALEALRSFDDYNECKPFRLLGTRDEARRLMAQASAVATVLKHIVENNPGVPEIDLADALRGITTLLELADFSAAQEFGQ